MAEGVRRLLKILFFLMTRFSDKSIKIFFAKEQEIRKRVVRILGVINLSFEISFIILSYDFISIKF